MADRLSREEFFGKLAPLSEEQLQKALWTLYYRGSAQMRERIEDAIDPKQAAARKAATNTPPDGAKVLMEVEYFAELARSGAYFARDRRVSPSERTKWRVTFKQLITDAVAALRGTDHDSAARAVGIMIDVACEADHTTYFRSEDPIEAARLVVSDVVDALWSATFHQYGWEGFIQTAAPQLIRWESRYGWTRTGFGQTAERERSLASVVARMLPTADSWGAFALAYSDALDALVGGRGGPMEWRSPETTLADNLAEWHGLLLERLLGTEHEHILDAIAEHHALAGPERAFVAARLAHLRGDAETARTLGNECLKRLPGHPGFKEFAAQLA